MKRETENNKRRRLFKRSKSDLPPLALTKRDVLMLALVSDYRFLTTFQIQALVGGSKHNVSERLSRLFQHGYIDRPDHQRELRSEGQRVLVHALGAKGARLLIERSGETGSPPRHLAEDNRTAKRVHLAHTLMVSQFRVCLTLACQRHASIDLALWEIPERALARVLLAGRRVPVVPDAYFILRDADGHTAHFYLEADRGTMTHDRFLRKLQAYWRANSSGSSSLFPRSFRVLSITLSQARMENFLITAATADRKKKGSRMFYFACQDAYSLDQFEPILDFIWRTPADAKTHSLLEGNRAANSS